MKRELIIYGAGTWGKNAFEMLAKDFDIKFFVDNNTSLAGTELFGVKIISGDEIAEYYKPDDMDLVISTIHYVEIIQNLNQKGINNYYIYYHGVIYPYNASQNQMEKCCSRCLMDNSSDKYILFTEKGECNYCTTAIKNKDELYFPNEIGREKLEAIVEKIKLSEKDKKYDCIMGISGGLDSSYLAYLGYKLGLRVLAIHIDDGYNTEIAKSNINKLISATGFDMEVIRPDARQYNDLILSYMKAGVPNVAVPQDNILFAYIYKKVREYGLKYFLSGANFSLECILQKGNTHTYMDLDNLLDIHNIFGKEDIDKLEFLSNEQRNKDVISFGIETPMLLNYINYNRKKAFEELKEFCGFEYYGRKHLENILTSFIQCYWFPKKFGVDKRKSHLSSMIASGQMSREEANLELSEPIYNEVQMQEWIGIIKENLHISNSEFEEIMAAKSHQHNEYKVGKGFF